MLTTTKTRGLRDTLSTLGEALTALREGEQRTLKLAENVLLIAVIAGQALRQDRRLRISLDAHVRRALKRAGPGDLDELEAELDQAPHRYENPCPARQAVDDWSKHIEFRSWRIVPPADEPSLVRSGEPGVPLSEDRIDALTNHLRRGWNAYHLLAIAYRTVGRRAPELFGTLTVEQEQAQIDADQALVKEALDALRGMPHFAAQLCDRDGVRIRPDADCVKDLFDAALAKASRA